MFDINLTKRGHRLYTKCIDKTYKSFAGPHKERLDTYLQDDAELARLQLERADLIYRRHLECLDAAQSGKDGEVEVLEAAGKLEDL